MAKRKEVRPQERWNIFARDNYTCRYCGAKPPDVILHVDHAHPVAKGGSNDPGNLVTACSNCNYGKSDKVLLPQEETERSKVMNFAMTLAHYPQSAGYALDHFEAQSKRLDELGVEFDNSVAVLASAALTAAAAIWAKAGRDKRMFMKLAGGFFDDMEKKQ